MWKANYIWIEGERNPKNFYLYARKNFIINKDVKSVGTKVFADSRYNLYVNGRFVGRGPVRSDPRWQYYDEYDLAPYLKEGENTIAMLVRHFGEGNFRYIPGPAVILFELDGEYADGSQFGVISDESWKLYHETAWEWDTPKMDLQLDFPEVFDLRKELAGWNQPDFSDAAWKNAVIVGKPYMEPWIRLIPRDIPQMMYNNIQPVDILEVGEMGGTQDTEYFEIKPLLNSDKSAIFYLAAWFYSPEDGDGRVEFGATFSNKVLVNDELISSVSNYLKSDSDYLSLETDLKAGWNKILVKGISSALFNPLMFVRIYDSKNHILKTSANKDLSDTNKWMLAAPFPVVPTNSSEDIDTKYPPEDTLDFSAAYNTSNGEIRWREVIGKTAEPENIALLIEMEPRLGLSKPDLVQKISAGGNFPLIITVPKESKGIYIVLDFGREVFGYPAFDLTCKSEGIIDLGYAERLSDGIVNPYRAGVYYVDRYIIRDGEQTHQNFEMRAFRYMIAVFRNFEDIVQVKNISLVFSTYPVQYRGHFTCDEQLLNRIWDVGRYTVQLNMEDAFTDCPWRERGQWWGDIMVESIVSHYAFGDTILTKKAIRQISESQDESGKIQAMYPGEFNSILPDFEAIWVIILASYYMHTGDLDFIKEMLPVADKLFAMFDKYIDSDGLVNNPGGWILIDWQDVDNRGESSGMNAFYYKALADAAWLAGEVGRNDLKIKYSKKAESIKSAMNKFLWMPDKGVYADCRVDGKLSDKISQQVNSLAVLYGIADESNWQGIMEYIADEGNEVTPTGSPYFGYYFIEAMDKAGLSSRALEFIRDMWGWMLDEGATTWWEVWDDDHSLCHGWSSAPTYYLLANLMGITPAAPGFKKVRIMPNPLEVSILNGTVPTVRGDIKVSMKNADDKLVSAIEIPVGMECDYVINDFVAEGTTVEMDRKLVFSKDIKSEEYPLTVESDGAHIPIKSGVHTIVVRPENY